MFRTTSLQSRSICYRNCMRRHYSQLEYIIRSYIYDTVICIYTVKRWCRQLHTLWCAKVVYIGTQQQRGASTLNWHASGTIGMYVCTYVCKVRLSIDLHVVDTLAFNAHDDSTLLQPLCFTALYLHFCLVSSMQGLIMFLIHCLHFQLLVVPLLSSNRICPLPHFIVDPVLSLLLPSSCLAVAAMFVSVGLLCPQLVQFGGSHC